MKNRVVKKKKVTPMHVTIRVTIQTAILATEYEKHFEKKFEVVVKELLALSGKINVVFENTVLAPLSISYSKRPKPLLKEHLKAGKRRPYFHYLEFRSELKIPLVDFANTPPEPPSRALKNLFSFGYLTKSFVRQIMIYLNLAKPGAFKVADGISMIETVMRKSTTDVEPFDRLLSIVPEALEFQKELKWPPIQELQLEPFLSWLQVHWRAFEVMASNRLERGLNAFSYLFHQSLVHEGDSDLFYAVLGLEALFVSGRDGVEKQVDAKTQILFGTRTDFKKRFSQMYDFRSRYIHGQLNISNKFYLDDGADNAERVSHYDHTCFAVLILIASIQKHYELNKVELDFVLALKE